MTLVIKAYLRFLDCLPKLFTWYGLWVFDMFCFLSGAQPNSRNMLMLGFDELSPLYVCLVLLRFLLCITQTGYIHPDEFFQSLEPVAGMFQEVHGVDNVLSVFCAHHHNKLSNIA